MRERGFGAIAYILIAAGVVAGLAMLAWGIYGKGEAAGVAKERAVWQGKESKELAAANAKILKLEQEARDREARQALALAEASADYQKRIADEKKKRDAAVAAARAGALVLRDPGRPVGACPDRGEAPGAPAGTVGRDGAAGGELSREAAAFLLELAGEADAVAEQLTACQAVVKADRTR